MKPHEAIAYILLNTTTISTIVSDRVRYGLRPTGMITPCINFYEIAGGIRNNGMESVVYSINPRTATAQSAINLSRLIIDLFCGSCGTGIYGIINNSFEITRASLENGGGLIPEPDEEVFNAPVDIRFVYPVSTIS